MKGPRPTSRSARARVRGATIAAFVALAPLLPAAAVAVGTLKVDTALPYVCALPSGPQAATVRITAAFPERTDVGEEIRPADVTTTVELPAAAVADLAALQAATVRAETRLTVAVAQGEQHAEATWRGTAQPVDVPAEGPLVLTATGDVPSLTTDRAGELTLTAGSLAVDLAPGTAEGTTAAPATASLSVLCAPGPDAQDRTLLATVPVGDGAGTGTPTGEPGTTPASPSAPTPTGPGLPSRPLPSLRTAPGDAEPTDGAPKDPKAAGQQADRGPKAADEGTPPGTTPAPRPPAPSCLTKDPTPMSLSAYITGYANVRKLNGASLIPVSCILIEQGLMEFPPDPPPEGEFHMFTLSHGNLSYQGRKQTPPFTATFLTFDFQPVTATMVLEQTGPITISTLLRIVATGDNYLDNTVRAPLVLRVLDVKVDGVKLDVGPSCRTATSLTSPDPQAARYPGDHLLMTGLGKIPLGEPAQGYILTSGGPLTGEVTIPAFKGCGSGGENFDRLLTASISGPGNYVKQMQGQTCTVLSDVPTDDPQCTEDLQPYVVPKPER
ncbi:MULTISPECIES: DUF6801 domain-containing protein [unclassified Streptomyces]|uniref:DUF6801 domain-containing protein n=1 Tax=unclassified Streptomyces TaxID=2593676 RepID=UPI001660AF33|nr:MULTISPECIES: DUF6801 domain-containing protein [unclassified Streptomyces]MBD0710175.1 hypothetical protein [Streptomyces sp. CBMA291]MBD0715355.1 hypothetical protein [Streptomyces sp. CBMA370]